MSRHAVHVVLGLGANLGDPRRQMERAIEALAGLGKVETVSGLFASQAVGGPPQPDYLNAAVLLETNLSLERLLCGLLQIERAAGRERRVRWGPRTLDLDILWASGLSVELPGLTVPHPRLRERAFALLPLLEVAPGAADGNTGILYADLAAHVLGCQGCSRMASWSDGGWQMD